MGKPVRTLIREFMFAAVNSPALVPAIDGRARLQRFHAIAEDELDGGAMLFVQAGDQEMSSPLEYPRPRRQEIRYAIDLVIVAKNTDDVDAVIDLVDMQCRAAIAADPTAGGVAIDIEYQGIHDYGEDDDNLDIVKAPMRFVATYATPEDAADTPA